MHALVQDGSIIKYFDGYKGVTIGDIQYPKNIFTVWTDAEKAAIGIYEIIQNNAKKKDEAYYTNTKQTFTYDADAGTVTATYGDATAKAHADTLFTADDEDNGLGTEGEVKVEGLKTVKIRAIKKQAAGELQNTDWYVVRKADAGTAVPSAITTHRAAVRTKCAEMETAITNAADTPALETLYTYTEQEDGSVTRPLGEFPEAV